MTRGILFVCVVLVAGVVSVGSGCVSSAGEPKDFRDGDSEMVARTEKNRRFDPNKSTARRQTNKLIPVNLIRQADRERTVRETADEAERIQQEREKANSSSR